MSQFKENKFLVKDFLDSPRGGRKKGKKLFIDLDVQEISGLNIVRGAEVHFKSGSTDISKIVKLIMLCEAHKSSVHIGKGALLDYEKIKSDAHYNLLKRYIVNL